MKTIHVTGRNGYLGGHLVQLVLGKNWCVTDQLSGTEDAVIHLHWYSTAGNGEKELQQRCLEETEDLLARSPPHQKFIFASTASVYGNTGSMAMKETAYINPDCYYTKAKAVAEALIANPSSNYLNVRFGSLMGRGITRTKVDVCVNAFATDGWNGRGIKVWHPYAWKPVLHVRDAAQLIVDAIEWDWRGTLNAAVESRRAIDLAHRIGRLTQAEVEVVKREGEGRSVQLDCGKWMGLRGDTWLLRSADDAVMELRGYVPMAHDRNTPWKLS